METMRKVWEAWKQFGGFTGNIAARIALTVFYFTIFVPFGLGVRLLSDPLGTRRRRLPSLWLSRRTTDLTLPDAQRQF